jgi:Protein of unknown function (DUF1275)
MGTLWWIVGLSRMSLLMFAGNNRMECDAALQLSSQDKISATRSKYSALHLKMNNLPPAEFNAIVMGGSILAANAGFINVVSMAGIFPGVTVSHVTGTVSRIPISIFRQEFETLVLVLSILLSFAFGCFMAGFLIGESKFKLGRDYGFCLAIESAMLFLSFLFLQSEYVLGEWCAAFAMGLQNAMVFYRD